MGYTHYWDRSENFTDKEWERFLNETRALYLYDNGDELESDIFLADCINFNGKDDDAFETFHMTKASNGWEFCKTERKPYDLYVTAILCIMEHLTPDKITVTSDGTPQDWACGLALAREFVPACKLPTGVADDV